MKTSAHYIDQLKEKHRLKNDSAAAVMLGISRKTVGGYRAGIRCFDKSVCLKIAELLDVNPLEIMCNVSAESEKDPTVRAKWERLAKSAATLAPTLAAALLATSVATSPVSPQPSQSQQNIYYANQRKRRAKKNNNLAPEPHPDQLDIFPVAPGDRRSNHEPIEDGRRAYDLGTAE